MWVTIAIILIILGFLGDVLPILPGTPISYAAMIALQIDHKPFSSTTMWVMGILCVVVTVMDYVVPAIGTKIFGGTKAGSRGSTYGLLVGILVLPILGLTFGPLGIGGLLVGPFVGAFLAEKINGTNEDQALKSAFGSFIGFLGGTLMKIIYSIVVVVLMLS